MSQLTNDIKKLFKYKFKVRSDNFTDQFNRIYMTRALRVAALVTGLNW